MFEYLYSKNRISRQRKLITQQYKDKKAIIPLLWTEHCVECAAPMCYSTCPRYQKRKDGDCVRIVGGITPCLTSKGIGAKIEFRTWAKIESQFNIRPLSGVKYAHIYNIINSIGRFLWTTAAFTPFNRVKRLIYKGWFSYRQRYINRAIKNCKAAEHLQLNINIENQALPTKFLVDIKTADKLLFREEVQAMVGHSCHQLAIPPFETSGELAYINLHPANAEEHCSLNLVDLELVERDIRQGRKIKCVIWDLDNTLWDGVLIEDKEVYVREDFINLIKHLDACGIVSSIASKNTEEQVRHKLEELGILDYFVFSKINWEPKSLNIKRIIRQMNINPDTIVFVDDNPFERLEVSQQEPRLTCIDPAELLDFVKCDRFNMVVTEDSRNRRQTYKMLENLKKEEEEWEGNIDDFLISCKIRVEIFHPSDELIPRCFELLQRTNQLNSSGRRLTLDEVTEIVHNKNFDAFALKSSDRFGDYGIVGFLIVDKSKEQFVVSDFVISCRVANKKIEPTVINQLAKKYGGSILFNYKKTTKNGPMYKVIEELRMESVEQEGELIIFSCKYNESFPPIVQLTEKL